ncbi:MAG: hypothetical protein WCC53_16790, partial [Thermoanaerobaculia bacterium]
LGWSAPTGTPKQASPKRQPEGSPNFFRDFERPVSYDEVARMAVRTLTEVFEIPHPGYLMYKAFGKKQETILIPTLGLKREPPAPPREKPRADTIEGLRELVRKAIREASGNADPEFDGDGDFSLRFGSAVVFVRVLGDPPCVRVFSQVLEGVEVEEPLVDRVNKLNADVRFARLFVLDGKVIAAAEVLASPFVAEHLADTCVQLGRLADEIGGALEKEFGGRRAFEEVPEGVEVQ